MTNILDGTGLSVKPLEWRDSFGVLRAETPFGDYMATGKILKIGAMSMSPEMVSDDPKAAAQADYEQRILSALTRECDSFFTFV